MLKIFGVFLFVMTVCSLVGSAKNNCPTIKTKNQWAGKAATDVTYQVRPIRYVVIHHTASDPCSTFVECAELIQGIQNYQMTDLEYDDIGYNFLIGNDGNVYEGTGWGVRGSHSYGYNMNGTGIAFIGNFIKKLPTRAALDAAKKLLECGVKKGELDRHYKLLGGLQVISTQSPGLTLYNEIQEWDHWVSTP
ncbi:peptidoglycan-recognition protein SA-like [Teleopsis dalmanni]|uniref:peptidoglycan-recognition protein SA-like n=1 Tax=Teleopsis dalmanni TaxID=139649 RepID=UPI0018CF3F75|nr:peptidoglycan-recognition protein SA-like [Teleopsis dalmanni]